MCSGHTALYQDNEEESDHAVTLLAYDMLFGDDYVYDGQSPVSGSWGKTDDYGIGGDWNQRVSNEGDHHHPWYGEETSMNIPRCMI